MEFNTEGLKGIAGELAKMVTGELRKEEDTSIRKVETDIRERLCEIGRMTLGMVLEQADVNLEREIECECGGVLHYQRERLAKILSVFGWVEYNRNYYASCRCGEGKAPLDEKMKINPGQVTAGLAELLGMTGVELAFEYSGRWLERFLMFGVSENTVRNETQTFGKIQAKQEEKLINESQDERYLQKRQRTETNIPERVYGSLDGAYVRIEERGKDNDDNDKWREMKVGCFYTVETVPDSQKTKRHRKKESIGHQALRAKGMSYFCDITEADKFEPLFWAMGCQAKADLASEVVFVCDGAKWIWRLVERNFPNAVQIVDWFHAEERLENVARDALSAEEASLWLENTRTALWNGDPYFVVRACEKLASSSVVADQAVTYFRNNAHRMQYDLFRSQGYMIGSGTVESGCKQIVAFRLKRPGAQWNLQGAILTAKARAAWLSHDWDTLCALRDLLPLAA